MPYVISIVIFLAMLAALFDVISRDDSQIKGLPKLVWVLLIVFIPLVGCILWFVAGREPKDPGYPSRDGAPASPRTRPVLFDRSPSASPAPTAQLSTEEQLAALEREIAEEEELARIRQLEAEIEERRTTEND